MKLLITPAFQPTKEQLNKLKEKHEVYFINNGRRSIQKDDIACGLDEIEGIVCNFFLQYNDFESFPNLEFIQLTSVGTDRIPYNEIVKRGIRIFTAGDIYSIPMAEWAVGKTIEIFKQSYYFYSNQRNKIWEKNRNIKEIAGSVATIIGFGNVGRNIAKRLKGFGVSVCAVDIKEDEAGLTDMFYNIKDINRAVENADIVYLTLPITKDTYHIVNKGFIDSMKQDVALINISRGGLIDEAALLSSLERGKFLGIALDVFENEPLSVDSKLWEYKRVLISPHNSFVGGGNQERLFQLLLLNLGKFGKF